MKGRIPDVRRGELIRASFLTKLARSSNKADNPVASNGGYGITTSSFQGQVEKPNQRILMVRMIRTAIPTNNRSYYKEDKNPQKDENAVILQYDRGAGAFVPKGGRINVVAAFGLPILRGEDLSVKYDGSAGAYVPLSPPPMRIIRVAGDGVVGSGSGSDLLDAFTQTVVSITPLELEDETRVWAVNLNG